MGPTASGKTALAVKLARFFNGPMGQGEIISADSRQIYKELDIATNKPTMAELKKAKHHLIGCVSPKKNYSVADFQKDAFKIMKKLWQEGKIPFLVGGTGLYIDAIVKKLTLAGAKPNPRLRQKLEEKTLAELQKIYLESYSNVPRNIGIEEKLNESDFKNRRRLIRKIEILKSPTVKNKNSFPDFEIIKIARALPRFELNKKIDTNVGKMFRQGLIKETAKSLKKYSINLPAMSGIGYPEVKKYLDGKISLSEAKKLIKIRTHQYAKRQMTWFKRDENIHWVKNYAEAKKLISKFVKGGKNWDSPKS